MQHQIGKFYYLIEVEKDAAEAVFYSLKERNLSVFFNPNQEILDKYIPKSKDIYIVKKLVSEAPTQQVGKICTVSIEKMLVDIFCDETLFAAQQGAEMRTIFNEALLDVLYEKVNYNHLISIPIQSAFIPMIDNPLSVTVPSLNDILGDKLTAFAPNTTGIPYYKHGDSMSMEIIKQLYDIGNLVDVVTDIETIKDTFLKFAETEIA